MNTLRKLFTGDRAKKTAFNSRYGPVFERPTAEQTAAKFLIVWVDNSIDDSDNKDRENTIQHLREVGNFVYLFNDIKECLHFIRGVEEQTILMVTSGVSGQLIIPVVQNIPRVSSVYVFCWNRALHEGWTQKWPKIKGVFTDIVPICKALKRATKKYEQKSNHISFVSPSSDTSDNNLNHLDQSFMYTQILKEILLTIDFKEQYIIDFIQYCRKESVGNKEAFIKIDELEQNYQAHNPIWWYTQHCHLHRILNYALRTMDIDLIISMGSFVRDLHECITALHSQQRNIDGPSSECLTLYRGQGLSKSDADQLINMKGGLLSFNNFLSTSLDQAVSTAYAESNRDDTNLTGVLFQMEIDRSISSTPFARVDDVSSFECEKEILFSMHSIFRIEEITPMADNDRLWQVNLRLTSDNDPQLHRLTEYIREEDSFPHEKGWYRLINLLIKLSKLDRAQYLCERMLAQQTNEHEQANLYHMLGMIKEDQGKYDEAFSFYELSFTMDKSRISFNQLNLANYYSNIGSVHSRIRNYNDALWCFERAHTIYEEASPLDYVILANSHNNVGFIYEKLGEYFKALPFLEKALELRQQNLPSNHPDLATSYNNQGSLYKNIGMYGKALIVYKKALEIKEKTLPRNHPSLALAYSNIGSVHNDMNNYLEALSCFDQALDIGQSSLPEHHHDLQVYKQWIEEVKEKCK